MLKQKNMFPDTVTRTLDTKDPLSRLDISYLNWVIAATQREITKCRDRIAWVQKNRHYTPEVEAKLEWQLLRHLSKASSIYSKRTCS